MASVLEREGNTTPLSLFEREAMITDVLHRAVRAGPARGAP